MIAISAGDSHTLALTGDGTVWAWGANWNFRLGDGSSADRASPVRVAGLSGITAIAANGHSMALKGDGSVWSWGPNDSGQLGDGTLIDRETAVVALREGGAGTIAGNDWFLDLDPAMASAIPAEKVPVFLVVATPSASDITASLRFRAQDVGTTGNVYVFAMAPATIVKGGNDAKAMRVGYAKGRAAKADAPVACVLAQLTQAGQMIAVTAEQLQAYLSGVLSAQGASVAILNGVPAITVAGSTFFVGYGTSGSAMIDGGINRGAVTVPGSLQCQPGPPQTGWWWNPLEDGRGFSLEVRGKNIFFAAFLYDISGRSTWYVSTGPVSLEGSYYSGDLLSARGGQTLGGAYPGFPALTSVGAVTMTFHNESTGTLVWPGGTVPIQRFNIVPNGLNLAPVAGQPESGWWWNEQESGRGFFLEWQGGNLDIAGYMYDDAGNSVWYLTTGVLGGTPTARSFSGNWWSFGEGQTLTGAWKPNRQLSNNVAPVTIQFSGPDAALMTLPGEERRASGGTGSEARAERTPIVHRVNGSLTRCYNAVILLRMRLTVRRIGNSLGVIIPRAALERWDVREGGELQLTADAIRPAGGSHQALDELKRTIALEVVRRFDAAQIRAQILANLHRWAAKGTWVSAYDDWKRIAESGDDGALFAAMLGRDEDADRLRQSMPFVGLLPKEVVRRLNEEA